MGELTVKVDASHAKQKLRHIAAKTQDFSVTLEKQRTYLSKAFMLNANTEGSLVGGWPPEKGPGSFGKKAPAPFKAAEAMPAYLFRTGALMESFVTLRGEDAIIKTHEAAFGTSVPYAKFHQFGTEKMPKREIIFQPPAFLAKFADDVRRHLDPVGVPLKNLIGGDLW